MHCPTLEMTSNRCIQDGAAAESASEVNIQASASGAETTTLTVNGESRVLSLPGSTSLLDVLRNALSLQGSRFGCGGGHCGACKVLLDGRAVPSCTTPLWAAADKSVVTIEGLGTADEPHPLQSAFIDHQAGQCGYCLSGILMTAAALLVGNPCPSEAEIRRALDEHLCRCGAHNRIVLAILGARTSAP